MPLVKVRELEPRDRIRHRGRTLIVDRMVNRACARYLQATGEDGTNMLWFFDPEDEIEVETRGRD